MIRPLVVLVCFTCLAQATAAPSACAADPELAAKCEKIAHMRIGSSGVTRAQADLLADAYFRIYLGGCGGPETAQRMNGYWKVATVVGYGGAPDEPFRIDRANGKVSCRGKPTLLPKDFPSAFVREYSH